MAEYKYEKEGDYNTDKRGMVRDMIVRNFVV